ncbi:TIR domain-containing protein [Marinoscillum sp.]|uniref:TIR domain-containing protein n=1 Tax=Marinoscillum sp. TaxID=2024838 RepID=UPI003BACF53C
MSIKRQIFYSFHFDNDVFRVQQIRNIGFIEGNQPVTANRWEEIKRAGTKEIEKWIDDNMKGKTCVVVLVGEGTANRPWVRHEITKAWKDGKGVLGIYVHNIKCARTVRENPFSSGKCSKGQNPFETFKLGDESLSSIVKCYNPSSSDAYNDIKNNIDKWIEDAINTRKRYA